MPGKTWADGHWLGSCLHLAAAREHQPSRWPPALEGGIPEAQGRAVDHGDFNEGFRSLIRPVNGM